MPPLSEIVAAGEKLVDLVPRLENVVARAEEALPAVEKIVSELEGLAQLVSPQAKTAAAGTDATSPVDVVQGGTTVPAEDPPAPIRPPLDESEAGTGVDSWAPKPSS